MVRTILLISDLHGNLSAFNAVLEDANKKGFDKIILLGDLIDYGQRSNEVVERIQQIDSSKVLVNIWGNHEKSIMEKNYSQFSSARGSACAKHTRAHLSLNSISYLEEMNQTGRQEFNIDGLVCLAVHGSYEDSFWKSIDPVAAGAEYMKYDVVFSGHSHIPHNFYRFYQSDCPEYRNKKRTLFINPGSVGQPRNHNPRAQYALLHTKTLDVQFCSVEYEIEAEMKLFPKEIDKFYKNRLRKGI